MDILLIIHEGIENNHVEERRKKGHRMMIKRFIFKFSWVEIGFG